MIRSIMAKDMRRCHLCGSPYNIEYHHVFGGPNRKKSTEYGLIVPLCHSCHNEPPHGVHFDRARMDALRAEGQKAFEREYPDLDFVRIFHRNWL